MGLKPKKKGLKVAYFVSRFFFFYTHEMMRCSSAVLSRGHWKPLGVVTNINDAHLK